MAQGFGQGAGICVGEIHEGDCDRVLFQYAGPRPATFFLALGLGVEAGLEAGFIHQCGQWRAGRKPCRQGGEESAVVLVLRCGGEAEQGENQRWWRVGQGAWRQCVLVAEGQWRGDAEAGPGAEFPRHTFLQEQHGRG